MFGVDFSEIMVIMVVGLVVLGPERLPVVARTLGRWWGNLQRYANRIKADVNASIELEELRQMERKIKAEAAALEQAAQQASYTASAQLRQLEQELERQSAEVAKSVEDAQSKPPAELPPEPPSK